MTCGRPKNLEIAARNPLCGPRDRRRNFLTTRDGNRRRGNPSHPAKGNLELRQEGARRHRRGGNSRPPVRGKPRASGEEETPSHRCGGNPGPPGTGQTLGPLALGNVRCHPVRGKPARAAPGATRRRENFSGCGGGETPSHVRRRKLLGATPVNWRKKALSHPGGGNTWRYQAWGQPRPVGKEESPSHGAESPEPPSELVATGPLGVFLVLVGSRAAQLTLRNRRDGVARLGEAPPSHTWRGLVLCLPWPVPIVPDRPKSRPDRHAAYGHSGLYPAASLSAPGNPRLPSACAAPPAGARIPAGRRVASHSAGGRPAASSPSRHTAWTSGTPGR